MRFSVIVPVYNVEKYIERCLNSLFKQSFHDFEIIVIDDGSTDNSMLIVNSVIKKNPKNIKIIHQHNRGLGAARNTGVLYANGEYLVFVDSDDYIDTLMLEKINHYLTLKSPDILIFNSIMVDENGKYINHFEMCDHIKGTYTVELLPAILALPPAAWNKIYKASFWEETGVGYPEGVIYEDTATTRILLERASSIYLCDEYLYYYVQRKTSIVRNSSMEKMMDIITVNKQLMDEFQKYRGYEKYYAELEYIAVSSILLFVLEKINESNMGCGLQSTLVLFMEQYYPQCEKNKHLSEIDRRKVRLLMNKDFKTYYKLFGRKQKWRTKIRYILPTKVVSWYLKKT